MREENLSVYHCFIEALGQYTCMREENLSVYHCFIEALGSPPSYMYEGGVLQCISLFY